jgi:hypothetical protein
MSLRSFAVTGCVLGIVSGAALALSTAASGGEGPVARDSFAVFTGGGPAAPESELTSLADQVGVDAKDKTQFRVLAAGLGQFHSRLVAFPARSGHVICFSLLGAKNEDPGLSACYAPRDDSAPDQLRGERFSVVALQSIVAGEVETQVFGVAENSVTSIRVMVDGSWRDLSIKRNGFYLDLPGVAHAKVGLVEATLANGSTQLHNIRTGM